MAKNLVIVESPAKAKTIEGFLGKDYIVKSSFGHVRDLSKGNLSIDVSNNFEPHYEVSEDKKKVISELKKLVGESEVVWLASDEDREGEAISWHLAETLKLDEDKIKRIVFHEITKNAIEQKGFIYDNICTSLIENYQVPGFFGRLGFFICYIYISPPLRVFIFSLTAVG